MRPRLPGLAAVRLLAILRRHGFDPIRQSGSHVIGRHVDGRWTTVPLHKGRDLPKATLRRIMRDTDLTVDDLS